MHPRDIHAFVPTRGNAQYVNQMIKLLSGLGHVTFMVTDTNFTDINIGMNCSFVGGGERWQKRSNAMRIAEVYGLSYCLQIDDDIRADNLPDLCCEVVETLIDNPELGAVCPQQKMAYSRGWFSHNITHNYVIKPYPTQLMAIRVEAYKETKGFRMITLDDRDMGAQLWCRGWGVGTVASPYEEIRKRDGKDMLGGMPNGLHEAGILKDIEIMRKEGNPIIKTLNSKRGKTGKLNPIMRYDWQLMMSNWYNRFGVVYKDSQRSIGYED